MSHSLVSPSSAGIWSQCAGSPLLSTMYPDEDTEDAKAGEASHWVVSEALTHNTVSRPGELAPNGVILDEEMIECAQVMIDDVLSYVTPGEKIHVEEKTQITSIHPKCFGTPDAWWVDDFAGEHQIFLWDYKFGHRDVPADSWQNVCYVAGILDYLEVDGFQEQDINVVMTIVQPRSFSSEGPIKRHRCKAADLRQRFNILIAQAVKVFEPDPGVSSGSHCRDCAARHACPAARNAAANAVDYAGSMIPEAMTADAVSFELAILQRGMKAMEYRLESVKTLALAMMGDGTGVPGFTLEHGLGNRRFNVPADQVFAMGDLLGIETRGDQKPITPAEFDRRLKTINTQRKKDGSDPIDTSVISAYIERPSTGAKIVPSDQSLAIKAFTQ